MFVKAFLLLKQSLKPAVECCRRLTFFCVIVLVQISTWTNKLSTGQQQCQHQRHSRFAKQQQCQTSAIRDSQGNSNASTSTIQGNSASSRAIPALSTAIAGAIVAPASEAAVMRRGSVWEGYTLLIAVATAAVRFSFLIITDFYNQFTM